MNNADGFNSYAEKVGGVFDLGPFEAIPYNHWKKDMEWMVILFNKNDDAALIEVRAHTPREAVQRAIRKYNLLEEEYES